MSIDKPVPKTPPGASPFAEKSPYASGYPGPYMRQYQMPPPLGSGQDSSDGSKRSFKDHLDAILRRRKAVIIFLALSIIISVTYAFMATPLYTSVARLEVIEKIEKSEKRLTGEDVDPRSKTSTQIEIIKSRTMGEAVAERMKLEEKVGSEAPGFSLTRIPKNLMATVSSWFRSDSKNEDENSKNLHRRSALGSSIANIIQVKPVKASNLLELSITYTSPQLAHDILDNYLNTYLTKNLEKRKGETVQVIQWLREEADNVEKKLRDAETKLIDFTVEHGIVVSTEGALGSVMALLNRRLEGQWRSEETKMKAQAQQDSNFTKSVPASSESNQGYLNKLKEDQAKLEADYTQMRGVYSPTYPKMVLMKRKMKFIEDKIAQVEKNVVSGSIESAEKEEKLFRGHVDEAKQEVTRVKGLEGEFSILKKEVDTNSEFLKLIMKEIQETDIKARTISNNMIIVDPPTMSMTPTWPKKDFVLLIGLVVGLIGGVGMALLLEKMDDTLQNPDDLTRSVPFRRLGVVPDVSKTGTYGEDELAEGTVEFLAYYHPKTPISDSIRNIQMSILFSNPEYEIKCISVSSSLPSEGKTLVAVSFGSVMCSGDNKRVVIVDLDMRKPRIHSVFGVPGSTPGMSNILTGNGNNLSLSEVIHAHPIPGLYYITAGPVASDSVSLLHSFKLRDIITELRETFDYIVVDCPPVLGFPDVQILSRYTDGLVLVARQGYVSKTEITEAIDQVSSTDGANLLGVVFNRNYTPALYGYGYKYGYRYRGHYYHQSYKYYHNT